MKKMLNKIKVSIPRRQIYDFCKKNHIRKLSLFGSALRRDFKPASDVDILVEFEEGHTPGLFFFSMQDELSNLFGRNVDLNTPNWLSPYFRDEVQAAAEAIYDQT